MSEKMTPTEARQGRRGRPILIIMLVSIALALVVWFFIGIYGEAISPEDGNPAASENANVSDGDDLNVEALDDKAPSPTIEEPAEAPDAATDAQTLDEAPGGSTGLQDPAGADGTGQTETSPAN